MVSDVWAYLGYGAYYGVYYGAVGGCYVAIGGCGMWVGGFAMKLVFSGMGWEDKSDGVWSRKSA